MPPARPRPSRRASGTRWIRCSPRRAAFLWLGRGMATLHLTFGCTYYDHFSDLVSGRFAPSGIELTCQQHPMPNQIFRRFLLDGEFDLSELSMAKYASLISQRDDRFVAIPVFPSR